MSIIRIVSITTLLSAAALGFATDAQAFCGTVNLTSSDEIVIIGEAAAEECVPGYGCGAAGLGFVRICVIDGGVEAVRNVATCNDDTVLDNQIQIRAGAGNDVVAMLPELDDAFDCAGSSMIALDPYRFRFGIAAYMGVGADVFAGSEHRDWATSNDWISGTAQADSARDVLCGWGADDTLLGDLDNNLAANRHEIIHGGDGADYCDGDWAVNGSNTADLVDDCTNPADKDAVLSSEAEDICWEEGGIAGLVPF